MRSVTLVRLAAIAAITAGVLRIVSTFLGATLGNNGTELLYLIIDLGLVFAIMGIYLNRHSQFGAVGLVGFVLALSGAASIVGPDAPLFGIDIYKLGGTAMLVGLALLALMQLRSDDRRYVSSICWLASLLALIATQATSAAWPFALLGVLFGGGFVASGIELLHGTRSKGK